MRAAPKKSDEPPSTWRERLAALRNLPPLLTMAWRTSPGLAAVTMALRAAAALVPIASLLVAKDIINLVVRAIRHEPVAHSAVWTLLGLGFALAFASDALSRMISLVDSLLGDRFTNSVSVRMMEHASTLDLASFEDPVFYDKMERARQQARSRLGMLAAVAGMARQLVTLLTMMATVIVFSPWILGLLFISTIPVFVGETQFALLNYSMLFRQTPAKRELDYLRYLGAGIQSAKEVKLFGLEKHLTARLSALFDRFYGENRRMALRRAFHGTWLSVIPNAAYYGAYAYIVFQAFGGRLGVGELTLIAGAFSRSRDIMENLVGQLVDVSEQALFAGDLFDFFRARPAIVSGSRPVPEPIRRGFEFRDVSFAYPGSARKVLDRVSFTLGAGEKIALVGENGAGKTTLVKLLARLYDPTEGQILLDGIDLRDYDIAGLRSATGAIFQDYMRYSMPASVNIGFGKVEELDNRPRIEAAAASSLAAPVIESLPGRYDQLLGRMFEGGTDLSTGQWQKIALARAYMRDAQLIVLDEPTASLDARAEFEVYQRFVELTGGKMAVLISHRFSTVRMAGKILVLERGRIAEEGSHGELVARGGIYAELFSLQAAGYR